MNIKKIKQFILDNFKKYDSGLKVGGLTKFDSKVTVYVNERSDFYTFEDNANKLEIQVNQAWKKEGRYEVKITSSIDIYNNVEKLIYEMFSKIEKEYKSKKETLQIEKKNDIDARIKKLQEQKSKLSL